MFKKFMIFLHMIKFEHTIFALPFAYLGALLGSYSINQDFPSWQQWIWITIAMIAARTAAMSLNRIIDRTIDQQNPRTVMRALPAGLLRSSHVIIYVICSFVILFIATSQLSELARQLLPLAVVMLVIYSYTKRFTWGCHFFLGMTIGLAPLGSWIAVTNEVSVQAIFLFLIVMCWSAGFDILYACQDLEVDRKMGLYSIPSRFGIIHALTIARFLHFFVVVGMFVLYFQSSLSFWSLVGFVLGAGLLVREHRLISAHDLSKLNTAFFTMNGIFSIIICLFVWIDLMWVKFYG